MSSASTPALDLMRERLIIVDHGADATWTRSRRGAILLLDCGLAGAKNGELRADAVYDVEIGEDEILSFLPRQTADDAKQQRARIDVEAELALHGGFIGGPLRQGGQFERRRDQGVVDGSQTTSSIPLRMPVTSCALTRSSPSRPIPFSGVRISAA